MIRGVSITVLRPTCGGRDRFGDAAEGVPKPETVDNVLIAPGGEAGSTNDLEAARTDGDMLTVQVHFPKTYTKELRGCELMLPGQYAPFSPYRVDGQPMPYLEENTPWRPNEGWNRPVRAVSARG